MRKRQIFPELVAEIAALLDLLFIEADVGALRRDAHEAEAESVGAILGDEIERIGRVAERLRELAALLVADQPSEVDVLEGEIGLERFLGISILYVIFY